jgi:transcriptional regulator with XRE-family HTH domain
LDKAQDIGGHVREIRHMMGMSQLDLAEAAGVTEYTISELEQGRRPRVRPSTLRKLAAGLGVTVADLYTGVPDPKASAPTSHELTLEWMLGADNHDRHTALVASTAEDRARLVEEIDAVLASLEKRYEAALTDPEKEEIMERARRVGGMRAIATFGPAVLPVRTREKV